MQYSPGAVAEFKIVWCMLIAHIHEGLYWYFIKSAFYLRVLAKPTLLFMQIILYCMTINLKGKLYRTVEVICLNHQRTLSTITCTHLVIYSLSKWCPPSTATYFIHSDDDYQIVLPQFSLRGVHSLPPASLTYCPTARISFYLNLLLFPLAH